MSRRSNQQTLGEVISDLLKVYRLEGKMEELDVAEAWRKIMDPAVVKRTRDIRLIDGVLRVYFDSSVLREEFSYQKERVADLMNDHLKKKVVRTIEIF